MKMTIRGKRFIQNLFQIISIISLCIGVVVLSRWMILCEFSVEHDVTAFKVAMITFVVCFIIASISDLIATKIRINIRRIVKAKKAKTWWKY